MSGADTSQKESLKKRIMENNLDLSQEQQYSGIPIFSLSELNAAIKETIELAFPETLWVVAEISEIRCNSKGHCYLELAEREDEETIAQIRANIWSRTFRSIASRFEKATGESLKQGMKVLLQVNVTFHEVYGLSLNIKDIDPTYSLGEMARKKKEVIERLTKEGLINLNKQIPLPLVPQRIAVISSATAAGYGDFIKHIDENPYGYKIFHTLYQALMQGQEAEASVISALREVNRQRKCYDAVVIVRGGGSQIDLSCFDTYHLAAEAAKFPLPVITGIGHERDDTIVDIVAHTKLRTPTAVAEFLLSNMSSFEERLMESLTILIHRVKELIGDEGHRLQYTAQHFTHIVKDRFTGEMKRVEIGLHKLIHGTTQIVDSRNNRLKLDVGRLAGGLNSLFQDQGNRIKHFGQALRLLDPVNVLKRGYSITYLNEKAVKDSAELREGDIIRTRIYKGSVKSRVEALDVEK
jgi:exodeoxyribonuclease VII large subunit